MESNNKDIPDSTVNTDRPKVPPLILFGGGSSTAAASAVPRSTSALISRMAYNPATDSYCHVPTTYNNNTANNNKVILIPSKATSLDKLSYMIKEVDGGNGSTASSSSSSPNSVAASSSTGSPNKTTYGSQSRSQSGPVRNFLRPTSNMSLISKFSRSQRKVYSAQPSSTESPGESGSSSSSSSNNNCENNSERPTNSRPVSTTYFTTSSENPNQSIKLHIRRNQEQELAVHPQQQQQQVSVESPDSSVDSSGSKILESTSKSYHDNDEMSSPSGNSGYVNSSSDEASPQVSQTTPVLSVPNNRRLSNSVIRQLHPELLKQVEKQSHGNVVEISIDDGSPNNRVNCNSKNKKNLSSDEEDGPVCVEGDERDDHVSNSECNNVSDSRPNTITITIGEDGIISESGAVGNQELDSRRTKRKRKPAKQFMPELLVPRLKIRRKNEIEAEGSPNPSFSFETVNNDKKQPKVDSTNSEVKVEPVVQPDESTPEPSSETPVVKKQRRGRPKGSSNKSKQPVVPPPKPVGTGRGRGRPKGSTNKSKAEKEQLKVANNAVKEEELPKENGEKELPPEIIPVSIPLVPIDLVLPEEIKEEIPEVTSTPPTRKGRGTPRGGARAKSTTPRARRTTAPARKPKEKPKRTPRAKKTAEKSVKAAVTPVQVFEEETRMSADIKPPIVTPSTTAPVVTTTPAPDDESVGASNVSSTSTSTQKTKKFTKDLVPDRKPVTAETLVEYAWPQPQNGQVAGGTEMFMLQEQVSEYLGVKSFKRKYPDLKRRFVDMEERDFLRSQKAVSESECDLGLTALCSGDVLDLMFNDFPDKYEEFNKVLQKRKEEELAKLKGATTTTTSTPPVRDRTAEFYRRCLKSTAKWNALLNRQRREERQCSFDLQTYTLHYQQGKMKVLPPEATKIGHYPVTVLPGQYCDYYKPFTPTELKYLPLNTVLYGPVKQRLPCNNQAATQSDAESVSSSSDDSSSSDGSSSSSDDSSDESEEGTKSGRDKENQASVPAVVRTCKTCEGDHTKNKDGQPEPLLHCTKCDVPNHPSCLDLRLDMLPFIKKYNWQCTDCKNCIECNDPADEDKMLFCDLCDRGYHIYCVGLRKVPTGRWHCRVCSVCFSCGCTQASPEDRLAEWHHEFKKGEKNTRHFTHSLCVSCHKLYKKGQYCPSCLKVHLRLDDTKNLAECWSCEKWVHKECIKRPLQSVFGFMCDPCDTTFRSKTKGLPPNQRLNHSASNSNHHHHNNNNHNLSNN